MDADPRCTHWQHRNLDFVAAGGRHGRGRPLTPSDTKSQPRTGHRANRSRHTTSSSTQSHAKQQPTNAPQTNRHVHRQSFHFDTRGHRTGVHTDETSTPLEGPWTPLQTRTVAHTHLPIGETENDANQQTTRPAASQPHCHRATLTQDSATPTRSRARQGNHRLRELHRPASASASARCPPLPLWAVHLPLPRPTSSSWRRH